MEPLGGKIQWDILGYWGQDLEEVEGPCFPVCYSLDILAMKKYFSTILCCAAPPPHRPKAKVPAGPRLEPLKL